MDFSLNFILALALAVTGLSLAAWIWLVLGRGLFWKMDQTLVIQSSSIQSSSIHNSPVLRLGDDDRDQEHTEKAWPSIRIVIPARNEADNLPITLPSLLNQDYPGPFMIYLVDDESRDGTGALAVDLGLEHSASQRLRVLAGEPLPPGWTGKLWALEQGLSSEDESQNDSGMQTRAATPDFLLFTDADISHPPESLRLLVSKALDDGLDLVSIMAQLQMSTSWERLLIPAFVYFFAKLYPFRWVNDPIKPTAGAAGGCVLLRSQALRNVGGLKNISGEIIDDCALAGLIKNSRYPGGRLWLGLAHNLKSIRSNGGLKGIWGTVGRTAYARLNYSPALALITVVGMILVYLVPVAGAVGGLVAGVIDQDSALALWLLATGFLAWVLMAGSYLPTLKRYGLPPLWAFALPLAAGTYTLMTINSARRSWQGQGSTWKGRNYSSPPK